MKTTILTKNPKDIPISTFIGIILIIVFSLYTTSAIKDLPCEKNMLSTFFSNFVHIEKNHLLINLYALYALSKVEEQIGYKRFFGLVTFLLFFTTIIEVIIHNIKKDLKCSIGFSGILFGITTWKLVTYGTVDIYLLTSALLMVLLPSIKNKQVSLIGHGVGAMSGIIGGLLWKKLNLIKQI